MTSIFRYPGAKTRLLPIIRQYLDKIIDNNGCFCDVFVGGGSVLLDIAERYQNIKLIANDLDDLVSSFWRVIADKKKDKCDELIKLVKNCTPTVDLFNSLKRTHPDNIVDKAFKAIFLNRTAFSGIISAGPIGGMNQKSQWKIGCRYNPQKLSLQISKIYEQLNGRLIVFNLPFQKMLKICNDNEYAMYLDPPYFVKGNECYSVFMENYEHFRLAKILRKSHCNWVLSYDNASEIRHIYNWARIENLRSRYSISGKGRKGWTNKSELVIIPR
jgi:DNA adenine methylase